MRFCLSTALENFCRAVSDSNNPSAIFSIELIMNIVKSFPETHSWIHVNIPLSHTNHEIFKLFINSPSFVYHVWHFHIIYPKVSDSLRLQTCSQSHIKGRNPITLKRIRNPGQSTCCVQELSCTKCKMCFCLFTAWFRSSNRWKINLFPLEIWRWYIMNKQSRLRNVFKFNPIEVHYVTHHSR